MSEPADDVEVVLDDAAQAPVEVKVDAPDGPKVVEPDEGLDELKAKLEAATTARQDADRRAAESARREQEAAHSAHAARTETQEAQLAMVANAIETVKARKQVALASYRSAREAGDMDAELAANDELSRANAELLTLEQGKVALENAPKPEARPAPTPQGTLLEQICAGLSASSAAWLRQHPEYASSSDMVDAMIGADRIARGKGCAPDTADYFRAVERALGIDDAQNTTRTTPEPEGETAMSGAAKPTGTRTAPPAAPVSRETTINGTRRNVVTLSAQQREAADIAGISYQDYAKQLLALERETKH